MNEKLLSAVLGVSLGYFVARPISRTLAGRRYAEWIVSGNSAQAGAVAWLAFTCWR